MPGDSAQRFQFEIYVTSRKVENNVESLFGREEADDFCEREKSTIGKRPFSTFRHAKENLMRTLSH